MNCQAILEKKTTFKEVIPFKLYISSAKDVTHENISYFRISHIVNCSYTVPLYRKNGFRNCVRFAIKDSKEENILPYFELFHNHVSEIYKDKEARVLVHCVAGVSRSVSLVLSFLMKYYKMTLYDSFEFLLNKRGFINPNQGFWKQLLCESYWDEKCFGKRSVQYVRFHDIDIPDVIYNQNFKHFMFVMFIIIQERKRKLLFESKKAEDNKEEDELLET